MRIALVADTFPPLRSSGAVQLRDLSRELVRQGHAVTVVLPASGQQEPWRVDEFDGVQVVRLKAPKLKDVGLLRRTLAECAMPLAMRLRWRDSPWATQRWDGVVWYSPSIFHGPFVSWLKHASGCRSYLIIRDIFPEWAVDMGLMSRGLPYRFFDAVARYQYRLADVIGTQTAGNQVYFKCWAQGVGRRLEVLQNWLDLPARHTCSIQVDQTSLAGRKILLYAGNMGVAQGLDVFLELAEHMKSRADVGLLFVGRGSDVARLRRAVAVRQLPNVEFFDEIEPDEIAALCDQCHAGIVALDPRHKSHNIPGKFLTYMQNGLPVIATVNANNDLVKIIRDEQVGEVCDTHEVQDLLRLTNQLLAHIEIDTDLPARCRRLFDRQFSVTQAARQILAALAG